MLVVQTSFLVESIEYNVCAVHWGNITIWVGNHHCIGKRGGGVSALMVYPKSTEHPTMSYVF